ncbi:SGNH/GDSL hydrolase family protein [Rossellomorea aquimaris]|uniref:SGNH/GDSL hydrolase family protein n=1 Tax=Rossellomorea aquimaris TaxID=189382 RepID=UPI001CD34E17|nr:SGNH/GDSL hydrolase family protein [Rossellomorea aquimaris]MCA1060872.1 SGNH/GDSL hydrolase family protein [Rossellomorea aquimaris]
MKKALIILLLILCGGVIVYGNSHWNSMTAGSISTENSSKQAKEDSPAKEEKTSTIDSDEQKYLSFTGNWPEEAQSLYEEKLKAGEAFHILLMGSTEMDSIDEGWNDIVQDSLQEIYGDTISVESMSFETSTLEFIQEEKYEEVGDLKPNLIIFEPFVFKDNGNVLIEDTLQSIGTIMDEVKKLSPGVSFVLTPPQPIYQPANYASQVEAIQEYAQDSDIPYIDHWSNWPDVEDEEIKTYLDSVSSPNEKGHKAWAKGITEFLVKKQ